MELVFAPGPPQAHSPNQLTAESRMGPTQGDPDQRTARIFSGCLDYNLVTELDTNSIVCL